MDILQVGILAVSGILLAVQFKNGKTEYGLYISLVLSLFIFLNIIAKVEIMIRAFWSIGDYIDLDKTYLETLIKILGITYVAEFSSGICKDAGYQTIAAQIQIFGKLTILVLSMPILSALLNTIKEFLI